MTIKRISRIQSGKLNIGNAPTGSHRSKVADALVPEAELAVVERQAQDLPVDVSEAAKLRGKRSVHYSVQDIKDSDLADAFKELLISQRSSKQKIIQKISELQETQHNIQLRLDLRKQRTHMLQTEIMALETSYVQAIKQLDSLMNKMNVSTQQADTIALLLMA